MTGPRPAAERRDRAGPPVVVTGLGVVSALGWDVPAFTAALRAGRTGISRVARPEEPDRLAAELPPLDLAGVLADLGVPAGLATAARRAAHRSPLPVRAALVAAIEAWQDARLADGTPPPERIALVVGGHNLNGHNYETVAGRAATGGLVPPRFALQYQDTDHLGTISQVLGITGEGQLVGAASASGTAAIIAGARLVECGAADACLVVGALSELSTVEQQAFTNLGAMASGTPSTGPFDTGHAGFVPGQAAAALVLESAASAAGRGVTAQATLAGYAQKLDGNSLSDPNVDGEVAVMTTALARAGLDPAEVDYVNTHGTGSTVGDRTELAALRQVLGPAYSRPWVNATKALTGHCLTAAGVVEAVASVVQLREKFVHPNPQVATPIDAECRLVGGAAEPAGIRVALSNSFGFGGFNACVVLTQPA